jgi:hypothetical protein
MSWTVEESVGFKLIVQEKSWCHFRGHGFDVYINLNPPPPSRGNLFNFKSYKDSLKGHFRIYLYNVDELKFIIERTNQQKF